MSTVALGFHLHVIRSNYGTGPITHVRFDFTWWGFGWRREGDHRLGLYPLHVFWINSYRQCPRFLSLQTIMEVGFATGLSKYLSRFSFSGSQMDPWNGWRLRVWRFIIGGRTPQFIIRRQRRKIEAEWSIEDAAMEGMEQEYVDSLTPEQAQAYEDYNSLERDHSAESAGY